jgi:putative DNA primase/helicase
MKMSNPQESTSDGFRLLTTLFEPKDTVLYRPIETWTEAEKKRSRILYKQTMHRVAEPSLVEATVEQLLEMAATERANLFFGVCPRFGGKQQFDLAWQIRLARCIWSDVDKVSADEMNERLAQSGLPLPSITVASGNGFHHYWLLDEPYLIDDAGDPPRIETEWEVKEDKKRPKKYFVDASGERIYLTNRALVPKLSPKAMHLQDILKGLATTIGGDHTHDLSRILRIPGTLNRKDEKNGRPPVPCTLVELDASRRYSIKQFEHLAACSPDMERRNTIAKMPLPAKRVLSPTKQDQLAAVIAQARVAATGNRSQADFAACCEALRNGVQEEDFWLQVRDVSKFKERGREYFDLTWAAAAHEIRLEMYEEIHGGDDEDPAEEHGGVVPKLAAQICDENHFAQDVGTKLYRFVTGAYRAKAEEFLRRQVKRILKEWNKSQLWSPTLAEQVIEYVRVDSPVLWERPPLDVLNVQNGLLDLASRELKPHQPSFLSPVQLPVRYDPKATCPHIEAFVNDIFPPDAHDLAWEVPAFIMRPDKSIQKAVLAIGGGGNGKSTYLQMVTSFIGKENTSSLSLHKLESDRFAAARIIGKLANICADLPSEHLAGTSVFKAITGGDELTGEHKFKESFDFNPFCRLVFSANSPPRSTDSSDGFFDRWLVIPFNRSFRGTKEEVTRAVLDARLSTPAELSGLLNKSLDALDRLTKQKGFTQTQSTREAWSEFQSTTDPLAAWLDHATFDLCEAYVPRKSLRIAFNNHLAELGRPPMGDKAFGHAFGKHRPHVESRQKSVSGTMQWCYIGIGIAAGQKTNSQNSQD